MKVEYGLHLARVLYDDGVRTRMSPSLAALAAEAKVYLNAEDAAELGLVEGASASLQSESGSATLPVAFDRSLGRGTVYVPANLAATRGLGAAVAVTLAPGSSA